MFKRISSQNLVDLGEMEDDYRVFHLKDDVAFSTFYMSIVTVSALGMILTDRLLYIEQRYLFAWLLVYRGVYVLVRIAFTRNKIREGVTVYQHFRYRPALCRIRKIIKATISRKAICVLGLRKADVKKLQRLRERSW